MEILELKITITEMKNTQEGFYNRYELAEERTGELKDVSVEIMQSERRKKKKKIEQVLREMWGTIKYTNICIK